MRIVLLEKNLVFTSQFSSRCAQAGVQCSTFAQAEQAMAEIKKDPDSIDLVVVARELDAPDAGLQFAAALRKDARTQDVPFLITSASWSKADFARHQKSESGANAYFDKRNPIAQLDGLIEAVTGMKFHAAEAKPKGAEPKKLTQITKRTQIKWPEWLLEVKLMAAEEVLNIRDKIPDGIHLENPISLAFDGADASSLGVPEISTTPPSAPAKAPVRAQAPVAKAPVQKKSEDTPGRGIEISLDSEMGLEIEKAGSSAKETKKEPVPVKEPEIAADFFEVETSGSFDPLDIAADQAAAVVEPPAPPAAALSATKSKDAIAPATIDLPILTEPAEPKISFKSKVPPPPMTSALEMPSPVTEEEAAKDLPYLFSEANKSKTSTIASPSKMVTPKSNVNDSSEVETLKKYLSMREQDVAVLNVQLSYAKEELGKSEESIKRLTLQNEDLYHKMDDLKQRNDQLAQERQHVGRSMEGEVEQLRVELKSKIDKIKFMEERLKDSDEQYEKLKERVRADIRKIRVRERELESKLEILKRDSETLIAARENKILELKRKIDLLEFNYDTLQDKLESEKQSVAKSKERIDKVMKVLKLASGIVEGENLGNDNAAAGPSAADDDDSKSGIKIA